MNPELVAAVAVAALGGIALLAVVGDMMDHWRYSRRRKAEQALPLYERLARAHEREADDAMEAGAPRVARDHFREAQKIRREATDAMMRGEEPPL